MFCSVSGQRVDCARALSNEVLSEGYERRLYCFLQCARQINILMETSTITSSTALNTLIHMYIRTPVRYFSREVSRQQFPYICPSTERRKMVHTAYDYQFLDSLTQLTHTHDLLTRRREEKKKRKNGKKWWVVTLPTAANN